MQGTHWWLVCYDVRDPKRLRKTAKHMEGYGERMQYSVFRCWLNLRRMEQLRWELTEILLPEDDALFIPLCGSCVQGMRTTHAPTEDPCWPSEPEGHRIV
jgi:CRISPR-associated protein Cas2